MARRYLMRPQCGQRFRLDTWTDSIVEPCLVCNVAAGSRVAVLLQVCGTCTAVPTDVPNQDVPNQVEKETVMPKSKQNGGSDGPVLPPLDQLPALPGFAVPAGPPTAPRTDAPQPPPVPQVPPVTPQEIVATPPNMPPIPTVPTSGDVESPPVGRFHVPPLETLPDATPRGNVPLEPPVPMVPIVETTTGEPVTVPQETVTVPQKTVRLMPEEPQPGLPNIADLPRMPGAAEPVVEPAETEPPPEPSEPDEEATFQMPETVEASSEIPVESVDTPGGIPDPPLRPQPAQTEQVEAAQTEQRVESVQTVQQVQPPQPRAEEVFSTKSAADITLTDLISGVSGEDAVDVNAVLDEIPGLAGGPSEGGFSWHTLEPCLACWRKAYHTHVLGLVPHSTPRALNWGSLWHACWELWYKFGGQRKYDEPCDAVRQAGAPKMAGEVQRLMYVALKKYAEEEASTWDIRAVENNAVFWGEPERVDGKTVYVPISCRHDLIVAKRRPGAACHPEGPVPHGVYVCDHKCVANGERLWDVSMGRRVPVEAIKNGTRLPTVMVSQRSGSRSDILRSDRAHFADNGVKPVWEVELSSGRKMRVTENHPIWTSKGWLNPTELTVGDFVACAPCTTIEGEATLSDAEVELLGYYIGNGASDEHSLSICSGQPEVINRVSELLDTMDSSYGVDESTNRVPNLRIHKNTKFRRTIEECELVGKTAPYKSVPDAVLGTDQKQLEIFLAALWTVDGCVTSTPARGDLRIVYTTRSETLARDVQQLLWRLGIWSSNHDYLADYKGEKKPYWQIAVIGREAKHLFISKLFHRIYHREGMTEQQATKFIDAKKPMGDADKVPSHLVAEVCENVGRTKIKGRHLCNLTDTAGISKWVVRAMAEEEPNLQALAESKIHWDDVVSCKYIGDKPTTSVTIPNNPVFLSEDGIITHNTSSALTYDLTKGYAMDGQFKTNALVFLRSGELEQFGPLNGIIVSVAVKHKEPSDRSLHRVETAIDEKAIAEFYQYEIKPFALDFYRRLASERYRGDRNLWPRNTSHCVNRYGCCQFFDLCDIGGYSVLESMFRVDENRKFSLDRLAEPPMEVKRASKLTDPKKKAAEEVRKERTAKRKEYQEALMVAFSVSAQNMDRFDSKYYIRDNNTDKQAMELLIESLATAWPMGRKFEYPLQDEQGNPTATFEMEITEKGVAWKEVLPEPEVVTDAKGKKKKGKKPTPHKGMLTYKSIAEAICHDWWDLDRVDPTDGQ